MAIPLRHAGDAPQHASLPAPPSVRPSASSPLSLSAGTDALANALAKLPAGSVWQANQLAQGRARVLPSGFAELDAALPGGGWPAGALIELLCNRPGVGELSLLLPLLRRVTQTQWVIWIAPPLLPYAPALAHAGVPLSRLLLVRTRSRQNLLWAARQAAASGNCACVLAWALQGDNTALRRLQLAAEESATPIFLFRPHSTAQHSSPAPLRLALAAHDQGLQIHVLKRRGPPLAEPLLLNLHVAGGSEPPAAAPITGTAPEAWANESPGNGPPRATAGSPGVAAPTSPPLTLVR